MATFDAILTPAESPAIKVTVNSTTSSGEQALGPNYIFALVTDTDMWLKFGAPGFTALATISDFYVPAKTCFVFDTGRQYTSIKLFNNAASSANAYIQPLSRI